LQVKARLLDNVDKVDSLKSYVLTGGRLNVLDAMTNAQLAPAVTSSGTLSTSGLISGTTASALVSSVSAGSEDEDSGATEDDDLLSRGSNRCDPPGLVRIGRA
jgi:hypothetical protein